MTWLIDSQTDESFAGTYQETGQQCADAGSVNGTASTGGLVALSFKSSVPHAVVCERTGGDGIYRGFVSASGGLTAQRDATLRCTLGRESWSATQTATLSMNRR